LNPVRILILSARACRLIAARQQLAVVVPTVDTLEDAVDASPDVDGVVHGLSKTMMPDRPAALGFRPPRALKGRKRQTGRFRPM